MFTIYYNNGLWDECDGTLDDAKAMADEGATMPAMRLNTVRTALHTMPTVDTCMVTRLASSGVEVRARINKTPFAQKKRLWGI